MLQKSSSKQIQSQPPRSDESLIQAGIRFLGAEWNVIYALMVREMKTRFGRYKLGYIWAVLEPLGYVGAFSIIRMAFGSEKIGGLAFPVFFTMGIIPFMIFSNALTQSLNTVEANESLFLYRRIRPYHCVVSRVLLEFLIYTSSVALILAVFGTFGIEFTIGQWDRTVVLTLFFFLFCIGVGLNMAMLGPLFAESQKIAPIFIRPLFLLSGVFIPAAVIPEPYFSWLASNPLLHFVELFRVTLFEDYQAPFQSLGFPALFTVLLVLLGVLIYRRFERKVLTSGTIRLR